VNWPFIQRQLVLMASFGIALGLDLMPLPHWLAYWRPDWLALVLIYWGMALPDRVGLGTAWLLGMLLDVLTGTILGAHALALVLIAYVVQRFYLQLRAFPVWQQSFFLLFLLALYQLPLIWLLALGAQHQPILAWQTIISGSLMWPLIFASLRGMQGRYDLS
jgi:rod shape-determining protein MreD